ncbi:DUF3549 family protein [Microbulbifer agarilyticus]|uniref:DUF3549 family protein n=1 Tax=Microbulbifer agarilyticus TaxID=260552 RepID=UPI001CD28889|nr:DUF3549 family protein [Microbulbifer agarilyticus]MCA0901850.1 DUF3549 family protein [Microbulbifer agarilyticus]
MANTLSDLIASADFDLRWFDLGRRVRPISAKAARAFEDGAAPWPYPYLRQAWCGLLLSPPKAAEENGAAEPAVWFLRLPLDEQGKLILPIRDRFLGGVQKALDPAHHKPGNGHDPAKALQQALEDSGLMFTPAADKRAVFHAKAAKVLRWATSDHFPAAKAYAKDPAAFPWEQLALQGLADLAVDWEKERDNLIANLSRFATPALISLCQCLESEAIDHQLAEPLIARATQNLTSDAVDFNLVTAVIRGISLSPATGMRQQFLNWLLTENPAGAANQSEVLAAIGSRCNEDLVDSEIAKAWLERLSDSQSQDTFNLLLTDLLFLPELRNVLLGVLRDPQRQESVAVAFGRFLQSGT